MRATEPLRMQVFLLSGGDDVEYLTMSEAARLIGRSRISLRRSVDREAIPVFEDPLDSRKRLVRAVDVDRLRQPRPIRHEPAGPGDAAA